MAQPVHVPAVSFRELTGSTALKAWSHFLGVQVVQVPQVRFVDGGHSPLCGKWSRSENLCPQNPHIPMFVTAPLLESSCRCGVGTTRSCCGVRDSSTHRYLRSSSSRGDPTGADLGQVADLPVDLQQQVPDHKNSGVNSLPNFDSADHHGANRGPLLQSIGKVVDIPAVSQRLTSR